MGFSTVMKDFWKELIWLTKGNIKPLQLEYKERQIFHFVIIMVSSLGGVSWGYTQWWTRWDPISAFSRYELTDGWYDSIYNKYIHCTNDYNKLFISTKYITLSETKPYTWLNTICGCILLNRLTIYLAVKCYWIEQQSYECPHTCEAPSDNLDRCSTFAKNDILITANRSTRPLCMFYGT